MPKTTKKTPKAPDCTETTAAGTPRKRHVWRDSSYTEDSYQVVCRNCGLVHVMNRRDYRTIRYERPSGTIVAE